MGFDSIDVSKAFGRQHLARRAADDVSTFLHDPQMIGEAGGQVEVVNRENDDDLFAARRARC